MCPCSNKPSSLVLNSVLQYWMIPQTRSQDTGRKACEDALDFKVHNGAKGS